MVRQDYAKKKMMIEAQRCNKIQQCRYTSPPRLEIALVYFPALSRGHCQTVKTEILQKTISISQSIKKIFNVRSKN